MKAVQSPHLLLNWDPGNATERGEKPYPDGYNLLPTLEGKSASPRKDCFWQREVDKGARVGDWKWVQSRKGNGLFNLASDRNETKDLSAKIKDRVE